MTLSRLPRWAVVAVVAAVGLAVVGAGVLLVARSDGDGEARALPPVGAGVPQSYRIVYQVTTPDHTATEEHVVHRPFGAAVIERSSTGEVTAERWSELGTLSTRSQGAPAVMLSTAIAPSASDQRGDLFAETLLEAGRLTAGSTSEVGGRRCERFVEQARVGTAGAGALDANETGRVPAQVSRCIDSQGLVLDERWTTPGGERLLSKRAVELELGDDVPPLEVPDADPLPTEQGNGAVRPVPRSEAIPFLEAFQLEDPSGFDYVGRFAVVPPRLSTSGSTLPADPGIALYTDVWTRGPDLLVLDQGATRSGPPPFNAATVLGPVEVGDLGTGELAVDLRLAEVRITLADGGFLRLAGTVAPDELVRLAHAIRPVVEAR